MSFSLKSNFFANARGITYQDGGGVIWTFNPNTNTITANASGGGASGANPTASIGLTAINGSAGTWMRSDGAPALSQAITPEWTGVHIFQGTGNVGAGGLATQIELRGGNSAVIGQINNSAAANNRIWQQYVDSSGTFHAATVNDANTSSVDWITVTRSGATPTGVKISAPLGCNGATPPAQSTGWGTPTGGVVFNSFAGASATLVQCSEAIAELITVLKAVGILGA